MRQLTGLDAMFLNLETPAAPLHVSSVIFLDPSTAEHGFSFETLLDVYRNRLHRLPMYRWRLVETPFGLDHPYWFDDPDFDLEYHVRRIAVPAPGDERTLADIVARIHARPLDRTRPLWEAYLIEGMADGTVALMNKNHHATIDGVSGADILTVLMDVEPTPPVPGHSEHIEGDPEPTRREMAARALAGVAKFPARTGRMAVRSASALPLVGRIAEESAPARLRSRRADGLLATPTLQAPSSPFNGPLSPHRRFSYAALPLDQIKAVKNEWDVKVNDVLMALVAGMLRRYLRRHGDPCTKPLQAMVPISVRTDEQSGTGGNQVNAMIGLLPTHLATVEERLHAAAAAMDVAKASNALPVHVLRDVTQVSIPALAATASRTMTRLNWASRVRTPFNVVVSNVPGPPVPIHLGGARMTGIFPVSALMDSIGLNVTVFSYLDELQVGLVADREMVPDLWEMIGDLEDELVDLAGLVDQV